MYNTIKKLGLVFILLNVFTFQSLMADMLFYYNAAILPSIIASKQQTAPAPEAMHDSVVKSAIEPATINVLANDTVPEGSTITSVLLETYDNNWVPQVGHNEGTWSVEDNKSVTFVPNGDFSGGIVQIWYQITDQNGQTSKNWINLEYPVFVQAVHDEVTPVSIEPINLNVLANDNIAEGSTVTVLLEIFGLEGPEYVSTAQTMDGNWSVEANQSVTFEPNADFGGGNVWIQYQIKDQDNHTSKNDIAINYPLFVYAEQDQVQKDIIEQVTVYVLDNDTITGTLSTLLLESHNPQTGEIEYVSNVDSYGGMWIVDLDAIVFIPEDDFAGGTVGIWYQITDDQGYVSQTWVGIDFPLYVQANHDYKLAPAVEAVNVDVLENDNIGEDVTPTVLLEIYGENGPEYVSTVETFDGNWTVEDNQSVTFTPNENFSARYIHMEYQLSDGDGHTSKTGIDIEYPVEIYAEQDHVQSSVIETVNIDVVANDTNLSAVTVELEVYYNGTSYLQSVETFDGNWTVEANQSVTFTPNANFGGGQVWMWYQITDLEGRKSSTGINIEYPVFIYAEWDQAQTDVIETIIVDVLANDTNTSAVTIELVDQNYETGGEVIGTEITTYQGIWRVISDTEVSFEPGTEFGGGSVYMQYQITDENGYMSRNAIQISYPTGPSPVCAVGTKTELTTLEEIYSATTDGVSFAKENGRRSFRTRLDTDSYVISNELFGSLTVTAASNPIYFMDFEDENRTSYQRAELETGKITLYDHNNTWTYEEERVENENGTKTIESGGDGGIYSTDSNGTNHLTIDGQTVFSFKPVREIDASEVDSMLTPDIDLTLVTEDTAELIVTESTENRYGWNDQSYDSQTYSNYQDYITSKEYNSSADNLHEGVLHRDGGGKTIIFAEYSTGTSGTLVEVAYDGNVLLTENAGTWSIETITDEGNTYDVLSLKPILCGYEERLYKLDSNGYIIMGEQDDVAGDIGAEIMFSEGLKDELKAFFIEEAILDVDPSTGV